MHRRHVLACLAAVLAPAGALAQTNVSPEAFVRMLYDTHLTALRNERYRDSVIQSAANRRRFFEPALAAALTRELRASAEGLGGDPILATNGDTEARALQIRQVSADQARATVAVTFTHLQNERVELQYILTRVNGGWLVYDIVEPARGADGSLRQVLGVRN